MQEYRPTGNFSMFPPVLKNLLIINVIVFLAMNVLPQSVKLSIYMNGALFDWHSPYFRPWQFLTHMFIHANFQHIFFNMFSLWMFGAVVENVLGSKKFLIYYILCGLGAALLQIGVQEFIASNYLSGSDKTAYLQSGSMVGASGAIMGVLMAFGYMFPNSIVFLYIIPLKAKYWVVILAAIDLISGLTQADGVAHFAHLGGLLFGWIILKIWRVRRNNNYL